MKRRTNVVLIALILIFILWFGYARTLHRYRSTDIPRPTQPLSIDDYGILKARLMGIVEEKDNGAALALAFLRERSAEDTSVRRSCHALAHEIGRAAFHRHGDFAGAILYQDSICNSGYMHGIIEAYFGDEGGDLVLRARQLCARYPSGKFLAWECNHGIGHGFMYFTNNDLPRALEYCEQLADDFAVEQCANGVFMENFNTDQKLHPSAYLRANDPFYPCAGQKSAYQGVCYMYAPTYALSLSPSAYIETLQRCSALPLFAEAACTSGVGAQIMKENIGDTALVERTCSSVGILGKEQCIAGAAGLLVFHYGRLQEAGEFCASFNGGYLQTCNDAVTANAALFADEVTPAIQ